jgi:hypothetical protein
VKAYHVNLVAGWVGILGGILTGAAAGLFFHREEWMGGYDSHARRFLRLGHISMFGLGFLNLFFALSAASMVLPAAYAAVASGGLLVSLATMPVCCFLTAWRKGFRHMFPIPVIAATVGVIAVLLGSQQQ